MTHNGPCFGIVRVAPQPDEYAGSAGRIPRMRDEDTVYVIEIRNPQKGWQVDHTSMWLDRDTATEALKGRAKQKQWLNLEMRVATYRRIESES
jgi:hypothetical protein